MPIDTSQFLQTFYEESFEGLDLMESSLLSLDVGNADDEVVNAIFRAAHSIKGGSGTFGLAGVASFTHLVETLLDEVRSGKRQTSQEFVDLMLSSVDHLRVALTAHQNGDSPDPASTAELQEKLQAMLDAQPSSASDPEGGTGSGSEPDVCNNWRIRFAPHLHLFHTGNDPARILRELEELGDLRVEVDATRLPRFHELDPEACYLAWELVLEASVPREQIAEIFAWVEDDCDLEIAPLAVSNETHAQGARTDGESSAPTGDLAHERREGGDRRQGGDRRASNAGGDGMSIRVGIDKIDTLINMVGELVITQSMLGQLGEDFDMSRIDNLRDGLAQLERNTRELQESVMRIRMLPISFAFNRFPRLVRDIGTNLGKKVELQISGEQTELDKTVMEKISDPMVHLVRNSMDHGIESPEERKAVGKPETGVLHLKAYHQGGNVLIEVSDDGKGLDKEKIRAKAIANNLLEDEELPDDMIHDLIFHPGFSTAEDVSDLSGRGVGMDVVRRNVKELGGSIDVQSVEGEGTTFRIRLPLTLAIMDGQLIRLGNQTYIIPLVSIVESLEASKDKVNVVAEKAELYKLRDEYIPVVRLYQVFGVVPDTEDLDRGLLVVVEGDGRKIGLFVDELLAQQQVVVKSLEANFKRVDGLSGATILGDGTVALILDVPGLIELSRERRAISGRCNRVSEVA